MSRIGMQPITIPSGVDVSIDGGKVAVKGPKGQLSLDIVGGVSITRDADTLLVERVDDTRGNRSLHGLQRTLIANMVIGVSEGFSKDLEIVGVGYRAPGAGPRQDRSARRLLAPGVTCRRRRESRSRFRNRPASPSAASTSSSSDKLRPTFASSASPSPTRARASAMPASASSAKPASPPSSRGIRDEPHQIGAPRTAPSPRAQKGDGHRGASAPRGLPVEQAHLRPGDRRHRRPHRRERVDHGDRAALERNRHHRRGHPGRHGSSASASRRRGSKPWSSIAVDSSTTAALRP